MHTRSCNFSCAWLWFTLFGLLELFQDGILISRTMLSAAVTACTQAASQLTLVTGHPQVAVTQSLSLLHACRLDERPQQAALMAASPAGETIVYDAPPTGPPQQAGVGTEGASHDMLMAHHQTGNKGTSGMAEVGSGSAAQSGSSSPSVQRSALPDEAAGSSTPSPKGWWATCQYFCCLVLYSMELSADRLHCEMAFGINENMHSVTCSLLVGVALYIALLRKPLCRRLLWHPPTKCRRACALQVWSATQGQQCTCQQGVGLKARRHTAEGTNPLHCAVLNSVHIPLTIPWLTTGQEVGVQRDGQPFKGGGKVATVQRATQVNVAPIVCTVGC